MVLQTEFASRKKNFPLEIYWQIFIPSVISWFTDNKFSSVTLSVSVWHTDRIYPSVNSSVNVAATVKCQRIKAVGKVVGECLKYRPNLSPGNSFFFMNFFFKIFKIYNIKLYKLMVIQTNYANKIYIKHQKRNQS
jgi:hypothetical protein